MTAPTRLHVLHVEDVEWDARAVRDALDEAMPGEFELTRVATLAAALVDIARREPDVILLDLNLPDSTSIETVEAVHTCAPGVPLVVLTGLDDDAVGERALAAGAEDYLPKAHASARNLRRSMRYAFERERSRNRERELRDRLAHARRDAMRHDGLTALGTLVMGVAHEVNNPLMFIGGSAELAAQRVQAALDRATAPAERENLEGALKDLARIAEGVSRLAEISRALDRLRESRSSSATEPVDLSAVTADVVAGGPWGAEAASRVRVERTGPVVVDASAEHVRWIVEALVRNAIEASNGASGDVSVRVSTTGARGVVEVEDHGAGISRADAERVFVPFFTTKPQRTGLSLARAYRLAGANRGTLTFESKPGVRTKFRLELPALKSGA